MPLLAIRFLAREPSAFAAYTRLQAALLNHWLATGRTSDEFMQRIAPAYRRRYAQLTQRRSLTSDTTT